jgi:hypothetical protein
MGLRTCVFLDVQINMIYIDSYFTLKLFRGSAVRQTQIASRKNWTVTLHALWGGRSPYAAVCAQDPVKLIK